MFSQVLPLFFKDSFLNNPLDRAFRGIATLAEREDISRGIASGSSIREIAKGLQRAVSTASREVARHGGRPQYRASEADQQAWESALRPKLCLLLCM